MREFQSFHFLCFNYIAQITRMSLVSLTHTVQENHSKINARLYDENSNTNARTQVRKEGWAIHLDAMSIAARQQKYEDVMSGLAHATSDNSTRRTKSQNRLVALTRREPALRTALSAAKARLAAQQRRLHCFSQSLLCKTHIRSSQVRPCFGLLRIRTVVNRTNRDNVVHVRRSLCGRVNSLWHENLRI